MLQKLFPMDTSSHRGGWVCQERVAYMGREREGLVFVIYNTEMACITDSSTHTHTLQIKTTRASVHTYRHCGIHNEWQTGRKEGGEIGG